MQKLNSVILIILIAAVSGCTGIGDKIFVEEPSHVEIKGISGNKVQILTVLPITNNNGFRIKLKDLDLEARVNGTYLGPVKNAAPVIIPKRSKDEYPVLLELEIKNIILGITAVYKIAQGDGNTTLSLEGDLTASSFLINKKISIREEDLMQYMH
jgi:LEA14-like dessication related protein